MLTLIDLLQALLVSGIIVHVTYYFMRFTAHGVLWLIEISFKPTDDLGRHAEQTRIPMSPKTRLGSANRLSHFGETNHASVE
jgi:hypothetical protein